MSSSSYPGERRRGPGNAAVLVAVLFLIVFPALHGGGRAGAIRTFPPTPMAIPKKTPTQTTLFRQYFSSRSDENDGTRNATASFRDSKRRVPSCPDPLHN
nr:CLAVATA3/ESR (CLE)-related protein 27-like [Ipomoea batatas]GME10360.1 CLAVATA3/ESR (CLE)-related protein 27-like [Ipomoea batatas]